MQAGSQAGPRFHLPLVSNPSCKLGGGGAPSRALGQGQGCSTHPNRQPHCVPKTSPHPLVAQKPQGFTMWIRQTILVKGAWNEAFWAGPGLAQPRRGRRHLGSNPSIPTGCVSLGLLLHPPEPWPPQRWGQQGQSPWQGWAGGGAAWVGRFADQVRPPLGPQDDKDPRQLPSRHR